jgi:hypothetical protein
VLVPDDIIEVTLSSVATFVCSTLLLELPCSCQAGWQAHRRIAGWCEVAHTKNAQRFTTNAVPLNTCI